MLVLKSNCSNLKQDELYIACTENDIERVKAILDNPHPLIDFNFTDSSYVRICFGIPSLKLYGINVISLF